MRMVMDALATVFLFFILAVAGAFFFIGVTWTLDYFLNQPPPVVIDSSQNTN